MNFKIFSHANQHGKRWYFHARARNGETIFPSEGYHNHGDCRATVEKIKIEAAAATIDDSEYERNR